MFLPKLPELDEKNRQFENGSQNLVKESFTFISQLGSGSFGKVYKVSFKLTNQIYALKVLSKNQISNLKLIDQLKNEISILARCNHENIIRLYCAFEDKGYVYLVMELANDSTLFNKLRTQKKLSEPTVAEYMRDIIQSVVYLHSQNPVILHRDIKPENILISGGKCKIADFGWSNVDDEFRNTFCGTPDYLAPEMITGTGHNEKLDVWTLGVLMYELLHGHPPFSPKEKPHDARLVQKMIEKNILNGVIDFNLGVSAEAKSAIVAMLNPKDTMRPSARDLLDLDFFKKYLKPVMNKSQSGANILGQFQSNSTRTISDGDTNALRQKLKDYEARIETLLASNKHMSDLIDNKDLIFKAQKAEFDTLFQKYTKSVDEVQTLKITVDKLQSENSSLKFKFDELKKEHETGCKDLKSVRHEHGKLEETVAYLFKRTKNLSTTISDFYQRYVAEQDLNVTQDYVLSYDNTLLKLDAILNDFISYKNKALNLKLPAYHLDPNAGVKSDNRPNGLSPARDRPRSNSRSQNERFSPSPVRSNGERKPTQIDEIQRNIIENEKALKTYFNKPVKLIK
jgi:serine/threonine protein kinase